MQRREFLQSIFAACAVSRAVSSRGSDQQRPLRLLLRSSWQTVNIGDIAHTPGVLAILEKHLPGVEVRLWPSKVDNGVEEMLVSRFPKLRIVKGVDAIKRRKIPLLHSASAIHAVLDDPQQERSVR